MYEIEIEVDNALPFLHSLSDKSQRIVKEHMVRLKENPYPGEGGDKERLIIDGYAVYRMHVGRSYTVFYKIFEKPEQKVHVYAIMTIEEAHKYYGR